MRSVGKTCVIGAGRIGLPISVSLASKGCEVMILEIDSEKCDMINNSVSPFYEEGMEERLENAISGGFLKATTDSSILSECNVIISAIGTGISEGVPDVSGIDSLVAIISPHIVPGDIFILKTTLPIGTTSIIAKKIADNSGLILDESLLVAFCPERIVEGKAIEELETLPKIVGGIGPNSSKRAKEVMAIFGSEVIEVSDSNTAEMCKLIDNSYRMTRFGFAADIAAVSWRNEIDAYEAIRAANRGYARNNVPLPSVGVSGYCLTKDPFYLDSGGREIWEERGFSSTWITARRAADFQITEAVGRISEYLSDKVDFPKVVVAGVTYKENVDDTRLSHGREIAKSLKSMNYDVTFWDPVTSEYEIDGIVVSPSNECIEGVDCIIFTVPHNEFIEWNREKLSLDSMRTGFIFDGWGIISDAPDFVKLIGTGRTK